MRTDLIGAEGLPAFSVVRCSSARTVIQSTYRLSEAQTMPIMLYVWQDALAMTDDGIILAHAPGGQVQS